MRNRAAVAGASGKWLAIGLIALVSSLHGLAIWQGLGGRAGLSNGWPLWRHDHSLYYHSALVTRSFLRSSGTTAGYDPSFMAGYAKSMVFPASSTLPELVVAAFGGSRPDLAYKLYVLISVALVPWLIALACGLFRVPPAGAASAVLLWLVYIWTDWPINYAGFGMVPYFLAVPLGIVGLGAFARFLERGGALNWWFATVTISLAFLVHFTSVMVLAPGAALAYLAASAVPRMIVGRKKGIGHDGTDRATGPPLRRLGRRGHAAVWMIPLVVLAVNSFWWLPGVWLASTKGASDFAFYHPEGVAKRLDADPLGRGADRGDLAGDGAAGPVPDVPAQSRSRAALFWDSQPQGCSGAIWPEVRGRLISCNPGGTPMRFIRHSRSAPVCRSRSSSGGCTTAQGESITSTNGSWPGRSWSPFGS